MGKVVLQNASKSHGSVTVPHGLNVTVEHVEVTAPVRLSEPLGSGTLLFIAPGGQELVAGMCRLVPVDAGATSPFRMNLDGIHLFGEAATMSLAH